MSGPYAAGLGRRKRKQSDSESTTTEDEGDSCNQPQRENADFFFLPDCCEPHQPSNKKRRVTPTDAELVPKYRPEDQNNNVIGWLHKIDQLGDIFSWSNKDRQFIMQLRLRGSARAWYEDLEDYNRTWDQWKTALQTAFPRSMDFVEKLEQMLARSKVDSESMTKYYHEKLSLLRKCKIGGEDAISCIIRGLPTELRNNAKAYKCETPEQLYFGYLSSLENFKRVDAAYTSRKSTWKRGNTSLTAAAGTSTPQLVPRSCYFCRRAGHEARDCRSQQRCETCRRPGHTTASCWFAPSSSRQQPYQVSNVLHITYDIYLDVYKRNVVVNGLQLIAYIDTGSRLNILTCTMAENLKLQIYPSAVVMKGFGGGCIESMGKCEIAVLVDDIILNGIAEVTNRSMADIYLIIGQTMINQENISLVTTATSANFVTSHSVTDVLSAFQLSDDELVTKFPVYLKHVTEIPKQSLTFVEVYIDRNSSNQQGNTYLSHPVYYELGNTSYYIPEIVMKSDQPFLKIVNVGNVDISWAPDKLIARVELIKNQDSQMDSNMFMISEGEGDRVEITRSDINVGDLNAFEMDRLLKLLNRYVDSFARDTKDLGCTDLIEMHIRTNTNEPVYCKPYRLSHKENEIVNEKIKDLLDAGIIRESFSEYASPVVLIKKKGGDYRLCIDYRALNARTVKDRYPLPHIEDQVSRLSGKCFFTALDLAQGYYQVPINVESINKTAFVTPSGQYEFLKMPFGLANAPAVFSRLIQMTLGKVCKDIALYLDDVMIPTLTVEEGLSLLERVLQLLSEANLKLNLKKCSFLKSTVTYLGHEITAGTIQPGQAKINCVAEYKRPRNVHEIRQFIGLTSYFRKFIKGFAEIARPLTELTKKGVEWHWGPDQETAFETLKS